MGWQFHGCLTLSPAFTVHDVQAGQLGPLELAHPWRSTRALSAPEVGSPRPSSSGLSWGRVWLRDLPQGLQYLLVSRRECRAVRRQVLALEVRTQRNREPALAHRNAQEGLCMEHTHLSAN